MPIFRNDQIRIILTLIGLSVAGMFFLIGSTLVDSMRNNLYIMIDELSDDKIVYLSINNQSLRYANSIEKSIDIVPFESTVVSDYKYIDSNVYHIPIRIVGTNNGFLNSGVPYEEGFPISSITNLYGRVWTKEEAEKSANVAVITKYTVEIYFHNENPIGKSIDIPGYGEYIIIGIVNDLKEYTDYLEGIIISEENDSMIEFPIAHIFIPMTTYMKNGYNYDVNFTKYAIQIHNDAEAVYDAIRNGNFQGELLSLENSYTRKKIISDFDDELEIFNIIYISIYVVTLIFSGIIIMNTMFFSIKGRINEIGIRIAMGSSRKSILTQFIFESFILSIVSIAICLILFTLAKNIANLGSIYNIEFVITLKSIFQYILTVNLMVIIFSTFPAYYASKVNVVDALKFD